MKNRTGRKRRSTFRPHHLPFLIHHPGCSPLVALLGPAAQLPSVQQVHPGERRVPGKHIMLQSGKGKRNSLKAPGARYVTTRFNPGTGKGAQRAAARARAATERVARWEAERRAASGTGQ